MNHELSILTNDGWVVTLVGDREMSLGYAVLSKIIVQPKKEFDAGVGHGDHVLRKTYRLNQQGEVGEDNDAL